jgi:hypothetical protein
MGVRRDPLTRYKIDRRAFLALGVGAVAWACSRGGDDDPEASGSPSASASATATGGIQVLAGARILSMGDTRQAFVILEDNKPIKPKDLVVKLSGPGIEPFELEAQHQEIARGLGGVDIDDGHDHTHAPGTEVEDIFVFRHDFDREGIWDINVEFDGGSGSAPFQVVEDTPFPGPGDDAIDTESPTKKDAMGVDPICTRDPVCSMHDITIADALEMGKPIVISFATPKFCTSRACGPVVDLIEGEKARVGNDALFIHVEVWADDKTAVGSKPAPAFTEWKLDTEPWTYFIGADGRVKERWLGPVGADELTKAVDALIAG